jgi:hypothetical protein
MVTGSVAKQTPDFPIGISGSELTKPWTKGPNDMIQLSFIITCGEPVKVLEFDRRLITKRKGKGVTKVVHDFLHDLARRYGSCYSVIDLENKKLWTASGPRDGWLHRNRANIHFHDHDEWYSFLQETSLSLRMTPTEVMDNCQAPNPILMTLKT